MLITYIVNEVFIINSYYFSLPTTNTKSMAERNEPEKVKGKRSISTEAGTSKKQKTLRKINEVGTGPVRPKQKRRKKADAGTSKTNPDPAEPASSATGNVSNLMILIFSELPCRLSGLIFIVIEQCSLKLSMNHPKFPILCFLAIQTALV